MADQNRKSGLWVWIVIGLITATIVVATLFYIGWFNNNTHVDSLNGDNVEQQYVIDEAGADQPGEADWQNSDHENLKEIITSPQPEPATPPTGE